MENGVKMDREDRGGFFPVASCLSIADGTVHTLKKIAYKRLREELKEYFYLLLPFIQFS